MQLTLIGDKGLMARETYLLVREEVFELLLAWMVLMLPWIVLMLPWIVLMLPWIALMLA